LASWFLAAKKGLRRACSGRELSWHEFPETDFARFPQSGNRVYRQLV